MPKITKCPCCGAQLPEDVETCEYCGTKFDVKKPPKIEPDIQKEDEKPKKGACPNCGSNNVVYNREKQSETKEEIVRKTVGLCKACGYTWNPEDIQKQEEKEQTQQKRRKTWLWVLGWIFIFPVPLTILMLRPERTLDKRVRYAIIAIAWIVYIGMAATGKKNQTEEPKAAVESTMRLESNLYM